MDIVEQEYRKALEEKMQPNCPYCGKPLEISQHFSSDVEFRWEAAIGKYMKIDAGSDADEPECKSCGAADWSFVEGSSASFDLGLVY
jgi:hypothetical protein